MSYKLDGAKFPTLEELVEALYPMYSDKVSEADFRSTWKKTRKKLSRKLGGTLAPERRWSKATARTFGMSSEPSSTTSPILGPPARGLRRPGHGELRDIFASVFRMTETLRDGLAELYRDAPEDMERFNKARNVILAQLFDVVSLGHSAKRIANRDGNAALLPT
jgi:truncated hemoglobin YjbI